MRKLMFIGLFIGLFIGFCMSGINGCAMFLKEPKIQKIYPPSQIQLTEDILQLEIEVEIYNQNNFAIEVTELELSIMNDNVLQGNIALAQQNLVLPGKTKQKSPLIIMLNIQQFFQSFDGETVDIQILGKAETNVWHLPLQKQVALDWELPICEILEEFLHDYVQDNLRIEHLQLRELTLFSSVLDVTLMLENTLAIPIMIEQFQGDVLLNQVDVGDINFNDAFLLQPRKSKQITNAVQFSNKDVLRSFFQTPLQRQVSLRGSLQLQIFGKRFLLNCEMKDIL